MSSHNTKTEPNKGRESLVIVSEREDARIIKSTLAQAVDLSISEDDDAGGDPYNSTGHHVVVRSKLAEQD
jgi:hypothetical protein